MPHRLRRLKIFLALVPGAILLLPLGGRAAEVTIIQGRPIEKLDADGHPSAVAMAQVGAHYTFVKQDGANLVLQDDSGGRHEIETDATDYMPPAPAPASAPATNAVTAATNAPATYAAPGIISATTNAPATNPAPVAGTSSPAATNVAPAATSPPPAVAANVSPDDAAKIKQLNDVLGLPLLADTEFWQDDVDQVAQRLKWPQESQTTTQESYRRYANAGEVSILGASAYSMALYGKDGKPTYISIIFANAGDFPEAKKLGDEGAMASDEAVARATKDLAAAVKKDAGTISDQLTGLLGDPAITQYGNSASNRDEVHRWDWNDVAILLNSHNGQYTSIKIIPADVADHHGVVDVTDRDAMRDLLAKRVVKRDNGDVILSEIPMVDQGPKGYCVPATWERYLRYMDVPADLYVLAIMGQTGFGGGTDIGQMEAGVDDYVSAYHRRIETYDAPLDVAHVAKYIDQGLPLMWTCWVDRPVEVQTFQHSRERKTVTDWSKYADKLRTDDAALGQVDGPDETHSNGHMRLIIGYNTATNEIAISDSWGAAAAERWMYAGTAVKISQGQLAYLSW